MNAVRWMRVDAARWGLVAVLTFAASAKAFAALGGQPAFVLPAAPVAWRRAAEAGGWLASGVELALAVLLVLARRPRRWMTPTAVLAGVWLCVTTALWWSGWGVSNCGCLGTIDIDLIEHFGLAAGAGLLALSAGTWRSLRRTPPMSG